MKSLFLKDSITYDGQQLHSLFGYLEHGVPGNSVISWIGPCDIPFAHMVDGEDLREQAAIRGGLMLHFIVEIFDRDLFAGVAVQRLMAAIGKDLVETLAAAKLQGQRLRRSGDDIYWQDRKLSISIAAKSPISTLVHFAMNVSNGGTPVKTCALMDDFGLQGKDVAEKMMTALVAEYESILFATVQAKPIS